MRLPASGRPSLTMALLGKGLNVDEGKRRNKVALITNAVGDKEAAVIIWKSAKPRCFKSIDISSLPVQYYSQTKAWMTGDILETVLSKLNRRLSTQHRKIALLMDNAGCHPENCLKDRFSNIRVIFLPPNTISKLQPLDLGSSKTLKFTIVHFSCVLCSQRLMLV